MNKVINSNIAIDMGGKYTGVVSYTSESPPQAEDINALIITMPEQGSGIKYTVKDRTATRHRIRSLDRYKKARKLIYQILAAKLSRTLTAPEKEAISSIMKRRGYTRLESEADLSSLSECPTEFFSETMQSINNDSPLYDQFSNLTSTIERAVTFLGEIKSVNWDETLNAVNDKQEKNIYKNAVNDMKKACSLLISEEQYGHKHRKQYLEAIKADIEKDSRLKDIIKALGSSEQLFRCVGNISNLQLRALRWYFNDISLKDDISFKPDRFKNIWIRAYQFFHYPEKSAIQTLLSTLKSSEDIISTLCSLDPQTTIPPYEDQNNRHPPIDQTLLLSPAALDKNYPGKWERWTKLLSEHKKEVTDGLDEIISITDRNSRRVNKNSASYHTDKIRNSYILQRILDLSKSDEPICNIRSWSRNPENPHNSDVNQLIEKTLSQDADQFLKLAISYYRECDYAKRGLWSIVESPLLEVSGIHPPMKKKNGVMEDMIKAVLCLGKETSFDLDNFKHNIWNAKIKGTSTVRSLCKKIEDTRKVYGNSFKFEFENAKKAEYNHKELTKEQKQLIDIAEKVQLVAGYINSEFGGNALYAPKYANPFSLAQLYTILETDPMGFSSNCPAVIKENSWRMNSYNSNISICSRLVAESVRPFDGSLGKILERQAYEIAKRKANELLSLPQLTNTKVKIGIVIESNQFEFSASIAKIKKAAKYKKIQEASNRGMKKQEEMWKSKKERIKSLSNNICAYTGVSLGSTQCEIDHIIPRSFTKASMGTIFNSEANLIYVSLDGNKTRNDKKYTLENLNKKYLTAVFGTSDVGKIRNIINTTIENITKINPQFIFDLMNDEEIQCVRHALFSPNTSAYETVTKVLAKQYISRVNGTQAWFIRELIRKIKLLLDNWCKNNNNTLEFEAWKINSNDIHLKRDELGAINIKLQKRDTQPVTSHALDALCIFAVACDDKRKSEFLGTNGCLDNISVPDNLIKIVPNNYEICDISRIPFSEKKKPESRKLYKETIYAEHFLPIMVLNDKVKIGFDWKDNNIEVVKGGSSLLEMIEPYFTEKVQKTDKFHTYNIDKKKAYELLHQVMYSTSDQKLRNLASCINALRYTTQKAEISSKIYDQKKKKFKQLNEISKVFEISVEKSSFLKGLRIGLNGNKLTLPAIKEWEQIIAKFEKFKNQKVDNGENIIRNELNSLRFKSNKLKHRAVKQALSLPIIDNPSGGIRIKRKDSENKDIYQLVAANTPETVTSKGFPINNRKIDWNGSVPLPVYYQKNLTPADSKICVLGDKADDYVPMNEKRTVYYSQDLIIQMSLGTKDRRYVYVEQNFELFRKCLDRSDISSYFDLPQIVKLNESENQKFRERLQELICDPKIDVGIPRNGVIKIAVIGKTVKYYYSEDSKRSTINSAFENA